MDLGSLHSNAVRRLVYFEPHAGMAECQNWRGSTSPACLVRTENGHPEAIASIWLSKSSEPRKTSLPERGLSADEFVEAAINHLDEGRIQEAADTFAGLVELRCQGP